VIMLVTTSAYSSRDVRQLAPVPRGLPLSRDRGSLLLIPRDEGKSSYGRAGRALPRFGGGGMKRYAVPQPPACAISCPGRAGGPGAIFVGLASRGDVGFWGRSGNLVLDQSTTGFDPELT
jgi:hypothetical protein